MLRTYAKESKARASSRAKMYITCAIALIDRTHTDACPLLIVYLLSRMTSSGKTSPLTNPYSFTGTADFVRCPPMKTSVAPAIMVAIPPARNAVVLKLQSAAIHCLAVGMAAPPCANTIILTNTRASPMMRNISVSCSCRSLPALNGRLAGMCSISSRCKRAFAGPVASSEAHNARPSYCP